MEKLLKAFLMVQFGDEVNIMVNEKNSMQSRFPRLWDAFQYVVGGVEDKRRLCSRHYKGQGRVLEVGCSTGNISKVFLDFPGVSYVGLDIDPVAIRRAKMKFGRHPGLNFVCDDLRNYAMGSMRFGYILFAGCCHHIDDALCGSLIRTAAKMLEPGGSIVVVDPLLPKVTDPWIVRWFIKLDQGKYVRSSRDMFDLLNNIEDLKITSVEECFVGATPFSMPPCTRFATYVLMPRYLSVSDF